jgi:uncharacterized protein (DUF302 family)
MTETAIDGLTTLASPFNGAETLAKVEAAIAARGLTILARIDHGAAAALAGLVLRPTLLLLFGNAKAGTPLMQQAQTIGIDLPLKLLVWQDAAGVTQISYNRPAWLAARHGVDQARIVDVMEETLKALARPA